MPIAAEWMEHAPKPRPLTGTDRWNVFLSYRSVNRPWVLNLYDALREMGHSVFLDQTVLKAGDQLVSELQDALMASQAGVLIWSSATQDSKWVQREYQSLERLADEKEGFRFVPLRLDRSKLPLFAENRIFLDFADYPDGPNGGELLRLLHAVVGQPLSEQATRFASEQDEATKQAATRIKAAVDIGDAKRLVELFQVGGLPWRISATLGCKAAEGLTNLGRNDEALAMLSQLEAAFPKAIRPKQLRALALARAAAKSKDAEGLNKAQGILAELYADGHRDPETVGIPRGPGWTGTRSTTTRCRSRDRGTTTRRRSTGRRTTTTRASTRPPRASLSGQARPSRRPKSMPAASLPSSASSRGPATTGRPLPWPKRC